MINYDDIYNYLFALRISLQDLYTNEVDIIRDLKLYLVDTEFRDNINMIIFNFYNYFDINVSLDTIEQVQPSQVLLFNNIINMLANSINNINNDINNDNINNDNINDNINNDINNDNINNDNINNDNINNDNNNDNINNDINNINNSDSDDNIEDNNENPFTILNLVFNLLNHNNNNNNNNNTFEDVVVTTKEEDINKLKKIVLETNLDINCSICLDNLNDGDIIIELSCLHKFHSICIETYLSRYNHKCPICRTEIGNSHYNL
jgi:hypothetical protein